MPDREHELGALWVRVSQNGKRYMSGKINGVEVVCFENANKQGKQPDWRVFKSEPRNRGDVRPAVQGDDDLGF